MAKRRSQTHLYIPEEMIKQAKMKALQEDTSVSAIVRIFLMAWLDGKLDPQDFVEEAES